MNEEEIRQMTRDQGGNEIKMMIQKRWDVAKKYQQRMILCRQKCHAYDFPNGCTCRGFKIPLPAVMFVLMLVEFIESLRLPKLQKVQKFIP